MIGQNKWFLQECIHDACDINKCSFFPSATGRNASQEEILCRTNFFLFLLLATFSFKIKADGEQPNVKKIVPGKSLYYAFSFWYYFDAAEERTNRLLINFGFPPSLCNLVRIQTNYKPRLTTGGDKKPVRDIPAFFYNSFKEIFNVASQLPIYSKIASKLIYQTFFQLGAPKVRIQAKIWPKLKNILRTNQD